MKLGIRGHDLGAKGEFSLSEKLSEFGFDGVQLVPYKTYSDIPYDATISYERAAEIADELNGKELKTFLIGAYFNPVHSNPQKVWNGVETFKRYLSLAKTFNAPLVGSETGSFNDDKWTYNPQNRTEQALKTVIKTFRSLCDYAAEIGVNVGIEGASGHVCWSVKTLRRAVDEIDSENLRVIFDLYNYLDDTNFDGYMDILDEGLEVFGQKIHCFHMKDCKIVDGKLKQCPLGEGMFDFERVIAKIKRHNENAVLILEGTTGEAIAPSVELIKKLWK